MHRARLESNLGVVLVALLLGCGGPPSAFDQEARSPRRVTVWLGASGLDLETAEQLHGAGVDAVVQRWGSADLGGRAPVLRVRSADRPEGPVPRAIAIDVTSVRDGLGKAEAEAMWRGLETELDGSIPSELILDLPLLAEDIEVFLTALSEVAGVAVVPLLTFEQLQSEAGMRVARSARTCVVPAYGTDDAGLRGVRDLGTLPLAKKLESVAESGVRIRPAIAIGPRAQPPLSEWSASLDVLTENGATEVSTASPLDRSFHFNRSLEWNGRQWEGGESVALRWFDAARLDAALAEVHRLVLPEVAGWDLVPLPSRDLAIGLPRATLLRYMEGEGPEPAIDVGVDRSGRSTTVRLENRGPFTSAVSNYGTWIELSIEEGWLTANGRGGFERLARGTVERGAWDEGGTDRVNAVRFYEIFLDADEKVGSGVVRLSSSRSPVRVRWNVTLSDGRKIVGETTR